LDKNDVDKAALTYIKYADAVTDPEKQKLVGHYYLKNNDFENADVWFERAFRQTKDLALAAEVADRFRAAEPSRAIPWYEICAAENCTYEHAMILGDYYFEQGRASLAASWYEKCYTLSQETDAERVGRLIECYQSLKSKQKEILHWAQILGDMYRRRGDGQSAA
jgi:tetratricopeptide (TPR) repeat protein